MRTRGGFVPAVISGGIPLVLLLSVPHLILAQKPEPEWRRILNASVADQTTWINSHLRAGMPPSETFGDLILNKSEITLPIIEQKIEEVLRSPSPSECFTDKSIDPQNFIERAAAAIFEAGNVESLRQVSKLIKIDEKRFGWLVERTLDQARNYRNPFLVAYQGYEIGDPAVDSRIAAWTEVQFADKRPPQRNFGPRDPEPVPEFEIQLVRRWWAEAMLERYHGVPTEEQWQRDPIAARLKPLQANSLHDEMLRRTSELVERRQRR